MLSLPRRSFILKHALWLTLFYLCINAKAFATAPETITLSVGERDVSVWHWQAKGEAKAVIIFSHGASSAPWKYEYLIQPWIEHGFSVYAPLHVDSTDHPNHESFKGLASWQARLQDMQLLAETYGKDGYIAAGHSYGGLTALVKGGVSALVPEGVKMPTADPRVSLVLAFSPPPAIPGFIDKQGYADLAVPALIQTGTQDIPMGGATDWKGHLDAYEMPKPGGNHYALILDGVDHYFGGAICRPELPGPKQMKEIKQASDISILMIKTYALAQEPAKQQLVKKLSEQGPTILRVK